MAKDDLIELQGSRRRSARRWQLQDQGQREPRGARPPERQDAAIPHPRDPGRPRHGRGLPLRPQARPHHLPRQVAAWPASAPSSSTSITRCSISTRPSAWRCDRRCGRSASPAAPRRSQAYLRINAELWAAFRRGAISQPALARERFRRLLREIGRRSARRRHASARPTSTGSRLGAIGCPAAGPCCGGCASATGWASSPTASTACSGHGSRPPGSRRSSKPSSPRRAAASPSRTRASCTSRSTRCASHRATRSTSATIPLVDGAAARAAGVPFVWMDRGQPIRGLRPRRRVTSLGELADLL